MSDVKIVTVLRSGGDFTPDHVRWVKRQCDQYAPGVPFVCLSDRPIEGVDVQRMKHDWPGWWGKIELFEHFTNALYLDLDTVLLRPIDQWVNFYPRGLLALRKVSGVRQGFGSGIMRWFGDYSHIPAQLTDEQMVGGDQEWLAQHIKEHHHFQHIWPGSVVSYKNDLACGELPPPSRAMVVCFHGQPRPWDVQHDWIH